MSLTDELGAGAAHPLEEERLRDGPPEAGERPLTGGDTMFSYRPVPVTGPLKGNAATAEAIQDLSFCGAEAGLLFGG